MGGGGGERDARVSGIGKEGSYERGKEGVMREGRGRSIPADVAVAIIIGSPLCIPRKSSKHRSLINTALCCIVSYCIVLFCIVLCCIYTGNKEERRENKEDRRENKQSEDRVFVC